MKSSSITRNFAVLFKASKSYWRNSMIPVWSILTPCQGTSPSRSKYGVYKTGKKNERIAGSDDRRDFCCRRLFVSRVTMTPSSQPNKTMAPTVPTISNQLDKTWHELDFQAGMIRSVIIKVKHLDSTTAIVWKIEHSGQSGRSVRPTS